MVGVLGLLENSGDGELVVRVRDVMHMWRLSRPRAQPLSLGRGFSVLNTDTTHDGDGESGVSGCEEVGNGLWDNVWCDVTGCYVRLFVLMFLLFGVFDAWYVCAVLKRNGCHVVKLYTTTKFPLWRIKIY